MDGTTYGLAGDWWVLIASLVFLAIMVLVAMRVVGTMRRQADIEFAGTEPEADTRLRELGDRYERGEIDLETYRRLRADLDRP